MAYIYQQNFTTRNTLYYHTPGKAGVVPPSAWWAENCGEKVQDMYMKTNLLNVTVVPTVRIEGKWVYQFTALPDQEVKITHGKEAETKTGKSWHVTRNNRVSFGQEASLEVGGKFGVPFVEEVEAKIGGKLSHKTAKDVSKGNKREWSKETKTSQTMETSFKLPTDEGQALWQWILIAKGSSGDEGKVLTQQYAFTGGGTSHDRPRCYPGGSTDGYRYQKCHPGWYID